MRSPWEEISLTDHENHMKLDSVMQINIEDNWGCDSPYLHVFDRLEQVHQMKSNALEKAMLEIDYHAIRTLEHMLPNRKN